MASPKIVTIRVHMYNCGFGDTFLITLDYDQNLDDGRAERQILVDFGSRRLPIGAPSGKGLRPLAESIGEHANGQIDVVVVTHRHQDHLSAFGIEGIESLLTPNGMPSLVVRPWTEEPGIASGATQPAGAPVALVEGAQGVSGQVEVDGPGAESRKFLQSLEEARVFADKLAAAVPSNTRLQVASRLELMAAGQLANKAAVDTLAAWSEDGRGSYVFYGGASRIEEVVPGLRAKVLGPPTIEQHAAVRTMKDADPEEFWMLYSGVMNDQGLIDLLATAAPAPKGTEPDGRNASTLESESDAGGQRPVGPVGPVRWLTDKMSSQQFNSLLRIVRIMDDVLNNTSVILLFEVDAVGGPARMLFSGDAQIENWEYALKFADDKDANLEALSRIDLYKVGHHGSRNATPRTLFNLWTHSQTEMTALMSTKFNVYDDSEATTVPRQTLVDALEARTHLYTTTKLGKAFGWYELTADLTESTSFKSGVEGP